MDIENSMVIGAADDYECKGREASRDEIQEHNMKRLDFIMLLMAGQFVPFGRTAIDITEAFGDMPQTFLNRFADVDNETLKNMVITGQLTEWTEDLKFACGLLADVNGLEWLEND
jgi:hypothetical protein